MAVELLFCFDNMGGEAYWLSYIFYTSLCAAESITTQAMILLFVCIEIPSCRPVGLRVGNSDL